MLWVLKKNRLNETALLRWDGSFEHPKPMFKLTDKGENNFFSLTGFALLDL